MRSPSHSEATPARRLPSARRQATLAVAGSQTGSRDGYMEQERLFCKIVWGVISPLLANIYLNELDRFIEDTLGPLYNRGERRRVSPAYTRICSLIQQAWQAEDREEVKRLLAERRKLCSKDPCDPDYRRLAHVRYADDCAPRRQE